MTGPEMSRTELEAIAQAGKNAEAALLAIGAGPGPEFAAEDEPAGGGCRSTRRRARWSPGRS
jgi:hypothetical protein